MKYRGLLFGLLLALAGSAAAAAAADPAGRWALRSEGATLFVVELRHGPRGWSGVWTRPEHFSFSGEAVSNIVGGLVKRVSSAGREVEGGGVELTFADPEPNSFPDQLTIRPVDSRRGTLSWARITEGAAMEKIAPGRAVALTGLPGQRYPARYDRPTNAELAGLFEADQAARQAGARIDWSVVEPQDKARRARTKALLDAGLLASGDDFWHAAFIFQHGDKPEDYLLAHSLAVIAAARGRPDATWIAAATLDRYLQAIGQKQVYGTQYGTKEGEPTTQEPYDRTLLSDALRAAMRVPSQADQEKRRAEFEAEYRAAKAVMPAPRAPHQ
jgi:hypothetical protein